MPPLPPLPPPTQQHKSTPHRPHSTSTTHKSSFHHNANTATAQTGKIQIVEVIRNGFKKTTITSTAPNGTSVQTSKTVRVPVPRLPGGLVPGLEGKNVGVGVGAGMPVGGRGLSVGRDGEVVVRVGRRGGGGRRRGGV